MRFDFHWTTEGWRISEVNSDVPGGFIEAGAISALVAGYYSGTRGLGDPVEGLVEVFRRRLGEGGQVGLVHATAFTDDRQVMVHLAGALERAGLGVYLMAPDHVRWVGGRPGLPEAWGGGRLDGVFRFFPAEWLPNLPRRCGWEGLLGGGEVPLCNPGSALLTQSKRLPLVWDQLGCQMETWRELLPETVDPRSVDWRGSEEWVMKPALGRVGDMVGVAGATRAEDWGAIRRWAFWHPRHWVAQRRFWAVPADWEGGAVFPCLGGDTVGGRGRGGDGRVARRALIDHAAQDVAVLRVEERRGIGDGREDVYESRGVV